MFHTEEKLLFPYNTPNLYSVSLIRRSLIRKLQMTNNMDSIATIAIVLFHASTVVGIDEEGVDSIQFPNGCPEFDRFLIQVGIETLIS